jgi:hypothetical protein
LLEAEPEDVLVKVEVEVDEDDIMETEELVLTGVDEIAGLLAATADREEVVSPTFIRGVATANKYLGIVFALQAM